MKLIEWIRWAFRMLTGGDRMSAEWIARHRNKRK